MQVNNSKTPCDETLHTSAHAPTLVSRQARLRAQRRAQVPPKSTQVARKAGQCRATPCSLAQCCFANNCGQAARSPCGARTSPMPTHTMSRKLGCFDTPPRRVDGELACGHASATSAPPKSLLLARGSELFANRFQSSSSRLIDFRRQTRETNLQEEPAATSAAAAAAAAADLHFFISGVKF